MHKDIGMLFFSMSSTHTDPKRLKNIENGFPARHGFPWSEEEREILILQYRNGLSPNKLAVFFERNPTAIVFQLERLGCIFSIADIVQNRKITDILHFTQVENLPSIIENGLLGRETLIKRGISYFWNDQLRLDHIPDSLCCSISFPNYKFFYKIRENNPDVDWAVITLKSDILWEKEALFCLNNAASSTISQTTKTDREGANALENLFLDIEGSPQRCQLNIPNNFTTNPQAEFLFLEKIEPSNITSISFNQKSKIKNQKFAECIKNNRAI
jgi:hypothetical protein